MPGGLLQLVALGAENTYLTGNPQITYFKIVYRRYTNFSMEDFSLVFNGQTFMSDSSETTFSCKIPRHGDLLYKMYLIFDIPDIYVDATPETDPTAASDGLSGIPNKKFRWIKNIGTNIIKNVSISIGNQEIDNQSGEFIYLWHELNLPSTEKQIFYDMIGFDPEVYDPSVSNVYPFNLSGRNVPSVPGRTIIVPLSFWFCRNPGLSIPLIALQYQSVDIKVTFRRTVDTYVVADVPDVYFEGLPFVDSDHELVYRKPKVGDETEDIKNYLVGNNSGSVGPLGWILNASLLANYIFLETSERRIFASQSHQYLIEKTREETFLDISGSESLLLKWFHPTKYLIFRSRRSDVRARNDWTNYTNFKDETLTEIEFLNRYNSDTTDDNMWYPVKGYIQTQQLRAAGVPNYSTTQYTAGSMSVSSYGNQPAGAQVGGIISLTPDPNEGYCLTGAGGAGDEGNFLLGTINKMSQTAFPSPLEFCDENGSVSRFSGPSYTGTATTGYAVNFYKDLKGKRVSNGLITSQNFHNFKKEILKSATVEFNGMERFGEQPSYYFNMIQPFSHGFQANLFGVYVYSFALFPLKYEPSGACNMSRINKIQLKVTTVEPLKPRDGQQADEEPGLFSYDFAVFGIQYNILRIMGGMGGLVFGN